MRNVYKALQGLKAEIRQTLKFFIDTDIEIYGHITEETKTTLAKYGVKVED